MTIRSEEEISLFLCDATKSPLQRALTPNRRIAAANHCEKKGMVPEARLELASLAAEDFESPASTIPPLGPPKFPLKPIAARVNAGRLRSEIVGLEGVALGQLARLEPDHEPARALL
jgi:hypothetical protein